MSPSKPPTPTSLLSKTRSTLARLYADERGAEGLEKLLIIAAIVLPLLGLLIVFRNQMSEWVSSTWGDVRDEADNPVSTPTAPSD